MLSLQLKITKRRAPRNKAGKPNPRKNNAPKATKEEKTAGTENIIMENKGKLSFLFLNKEG